MTKIKISDYYHIKISEPINLDKPVKEAIGLGDYYEFSIELFGDACHDCDGDEDNQDGAPYTCKKHNKGEHTLYPAFVYVPKFYFDGNRIHLDPETPSFH